MQTSSESLFSVWETRPLNYWKWGSSFSVEFTSNFKCKKRAAIWRNPAVRFFFPKQSLFISKWIISPNVASLCGLGKKNRVHELLIHGILNCTWHGWRIPGLNLCPSIATYSFFFSTCISVFPFTKQRTALLVSEGYLPFIETVILLVFGILAFSKYLIDLCLHSWLTVNSHCILWI